MLVCTLFYIGIFNLHQWHDTIRRLIDSRYPSYVLLAFYAILSYVIYPIADARKNIGKGSTADDAIIEPAMTLLTNAKLYSPLLYDGVPISPGPGWIIQNAPFALLGVFWLMPIFYIALFMLVTRVNFNRYRETNIALILISSSIIFWELLLKGHDIISMGFLFAVFVVLLFRQSTRKGAGYPSLLFLAVAIGVFSTSRVIFIFFPILLSAFLWKFDRQKAVIFFAISLLIALSLHGYFYLDSDFYQPLHLFRRGSRNVGFVISILGLMATGAAFIVVFSRLENTVGSWLVSAFVCLAIPLFFISAGELIYSGFDLSIWEGSNYLVPPLPLLLLWIACKVSGKSLTR